MYSFSFPILQKELRRPVIQQLFGLIGERLVKFHEIPTKAQEMYVDFLAKIAL